MSGVSELFSLLPQHDLKRLLAYHSIENIGIMMGIEYRIECPNILQCLLCWEWRAPCWRHESCDIQGVTFPWSRFFIVHAVGNKGTDRMGGLIHNNAMDSHIFSDGASYLWTSSLNGFVSEFFAYPGDLSTKVAYGTLFSASEFPSGSVLALDRAPLIACFVKALG